jgi:DNA topoisomerase-1
MMKLTGSGANGKYTTEELSAMELDEIKKMILSQDPKAFDKKGQGKKKPAKKAASSKVPPPKKSSRKK